MCSKANGFVRRNLNEGSKRSSTIPRTCFLLVPASIGSLKPTLVVSVDWTQTTVVCISNIRQNNVHVDFGEQNVPLFSDHDSATTPQSSYRRNFVRSLLRHS